MAVAVENLLTSEILKPARYLGNELGAFHKPWDDAQVHWVLTYPEVYEVGASNLGHIILYNILNSQPRQLCDRAYLPAPDLAQKLRVTDTPLFAVESRRSLTEFDILGFSLSYELGATNILEMLSLAGIPLTWQERQLTSHSPQAQQTYPLIFAGGQTATSNPEPYADFFDFIALGDGEELLPEIGLIVEQGKTNGLTREELLLDLAQIPGVYVPQFYQMAKDGSVFPISKDVPEKILRRVAAPMPAYSIGLVPYVETVHDRLVIEVRRGCTRGCRFCQPGMLTRPARDVDPEEIVDTIEKGLRATGHNEFSLLSLSCSDYLALPAVGTEIRNRLKDENISLSLPSQRVDRFDENIANIIGGTRQSSLTFAPEAGTQRMRDIINKGLTNEELLRGVKTAYEQGWDKVKLYFMIGLPGETDADVLGIAETVNWLQQECRTKGRKKLQVTLTISNLTPKPHTPFQWHSVSVAEFERKQELLKAEFRRMKGVKVNYTDVRISAMEDFLGRGDRRLASVIRRAWERGAGMDSWWESLDKAFAAWSEAIAESDLSWKYRQVENGEWNVFKNTENSTEITSAQNLSSLLDQPLPWDHIETGINKNWLKEDLHRALAAITVPDCFFATCSHCGVCGPDLGHNIVVPPLPIPEFDGQFVPNQNKVQRLRVWLGKLGEMALVSHLDLARLFARAVRRSSIPIAFTGGYHPSPRIIPASALSLGTTSTGEIVDFELTERMDVVTFQNKLGSALPKDIPIYKVEEVEVKSPSVSQILEKAEYILKVRKIAESSENLTKDFYNQTTQEKLNWQEWVEAINNSESILWEQTTKSGKVKVINLRDRLFELEFIEYPTTDIFSLETKWDVKTDGIIRYVGSYQNDGTLLRPQHIIYMLEQVSKQEFELLHIHRKKLFLK
ncbi:TIGR03960 family B12-binding radical SAM protein [Okeania sp. SIO1I7]|uniref:TIGR03960 family B12-binding radical SAM protein n=1 Tax=Okeania sp. SIO1I7 TaxID=2607772 RepID=UPI0013FC9D11|nr:TIGR03960 family B12-binding radical SAM protein [Okeania sp. SIO1I7]NET28234.1 TIGR03960 family B12-binding radical SAM protein [Okeania sp. SIO1I7]